MNGECASLYADSILDVAFVVGERRLSLASAEQHIQVNMRIHSEVLKVLHAEDGHGAS
jgi:hypothetical protein